MGLRRWVCSSLSLTDCAGFVTPEKKCRAKAPKRQRSRRRRTSQSDSDHSDHSNEPCSRRKLVKTEQEMSSPPVSSSSVTRAVVSFCSLPHVLFSGCCVSQEHQNFPQDATEPMEPGDKPEEFQCTIEFTNDGQADGEPDVSCQSKRRFTCC